MQFPILTSLFKMFSAKRVHLDFAATTPVRKSIQKAMRPFWSQKWANPSAIYKEGTEARKVVEEARERVARTLRVRATGIIFTSGGTEANNLAIRGSIERVLQNGGTYTDVEIITTRLEHPSVQKTVTSLEDQGVIVKYVSVDEEGLVDIQELQSSLSQKTRLVSIAYVNSETGVIQDIKKISRVVKKWNQTNDTEILVHTDACQAPLWLSCALDALGVDMLTLDAGKCYGPKGVGVLAKRHGVHLEPIMYGGGQESGQRAGTENTAFIVGCSLALEEAQQKHKERATSVLALREYAFSLLKKELPNALVNGSREKRVANNINISLPGYDTEYAVIVLDRYGVAASTRSACGSLETAGSHVVREMTHDDTRALSTLRFTLGEESKKSDITKALDVLTKHFMDMQKVHKK